jgi:hypothetical protein
VPCRPDQQARTLQAGQKGAKIGHVDPPLMTDWKVTRNNPALQKRRTDRSQT